MARSATPQHAWRLGLDVGERFLQLALWTQTSLRGPYFTGVDIAMWGFGGVLDPG